VLVICRAGCAQADVLAALRARGLWGAPREFSRRRENRTILEAARAEAVTRERSAEARRAPHNAATRAADEYREAMREVAAARAIATTAGPDAPGVWDALALAARVEIDVEAALAEAEAGA
jgi:hypothetical protein